MPPAFGFVSCAVIAALPCVVAAAAEEAPSADKKKSDGDEQLLPPEVQGQIHVRYAKTDFPGSPDEGELSVAGAKAEIRWRPRKRLEAALGFDFSAATEPGGGVAPGDAYLQWRIARWLRIRAGHRKIPFSGLKLQSRSRLPTVVRGEYGRQLSLVFRDEGSADLSREVGVDLRLRMRQPRLRFDLGLSQGEDGPKDVAARFSARPARGLDVGVAVAVVHVFAVTGLVKDSQRRIVAEADLALDLGRWHAEVEGAVGEAEDPDGDDEFAGGYALLSRWMPLGKGKRPALEPLLRFDLVDQKLRVRDDHAWAVTGGLNFHPRKFLRLMLDVEHVERFSNYREKDAQDETRLLVQLAFDV